MCKKIIKLIGGCMIVTAMLAGCSGKTNIASLETEIKGIKESNVTLEARVTTLEGQLDQLKKDTSTSSPNVAGDNQAQNVHAIYTADVDTYEKKVEMETYIPESMTLDEKLNILTKSLSEVTFGKLPIEVMSIENIDGKKVATINLKESKENQGITNLADLKGDTWIGKYFQGSAGGSITATALRETLLQKEYKGEWIDGVKILYNGAPIEFEHVGDLSKIAYR